MWVQGPGYRASSLWDLAILGVLAWGRGALGLGSQNNPHVLNRVSPETPSPKPKPLARSNAEPLLPSEQTSRTHTETHRRAERGWGAFHPPERRLTECSYSSLWACFVRLPATRSLEAVSKGHSVCGLAQKGVGLQLCPWLFRRRWLGTGFRL